MSELASGMNTMYLSGSFNDTRTLELDKIAY